PDNSDATMAPVPLQDPAKVDLKKLRVAFYTTNGDTNPTDEIQALVKKCAGYFVSMGCKVTEDKPPKMKELSEARTKFSNADGGDHMRRLLHKHNSLQASPGLNLGNGEQIPSAEFTAACEVMDGIKSEQLTWLEQYDLVICPANAKPPEKIPPEFVRPPGSGGGSYTSQYNTTGWPAGVVRAGTSTQEAGMPLGIQVVGQPWRDDVVLAAMAYIEKQTGGWQPPPI
ncbi:MAG: amidase family protein, partial [Steroidobacter sp.]